MSLEYECQPTNEGYYTLTEGVGVPVRLFLSEKLFAESEETLYTQVQTATEYPGVLDVVITPDVHTGYVVPVGSVIATSGTLLQAACGYDIGCGNHFIELQHNQDGHLWVMVHTGSRGFGHGLATHYIQEGKRLLQSKGIHPKGGAEAVYFEPGTLLYDGYRNAVAAGGNFAIVNRLLIWREVGTAFRRVFGEEPELVYEISHNMTQEEVLPDGRKAWIHRKGATRAFPAGHPMLVGTKWEKTGHPVLIPGSMGDKSYVLTPKAGAANSLYSVNHGCGRRMSRSEAKHTLTQSGVNKQLKDRNVLVNAGGDVPIDESPDVYKPSSDVIAAVVAAGLAEVAHVLTPIASIKGTE